MKRCGLNLFLTLVLVATTFCQNQTYFQHLTTNDGLSFGAVSTLTQDTLGFLWIGTKDGLNRYDGREFKVYNNRNSSLLGNGISKLLVDKNQTLWVGTYNGLYSYDPMQGTFNLMKLEGTPDLSSSIQVNDIVEVGGGHAWIASENGLYQLTNTKNEFAFSKFESQKFRDLSIKSILFDPEDTSLYVGCKDQGIWKVNLKTLDVLRASFSDVSVDFSDLNVRALAKIDGNILVGTWSQGIFVVNKQGVIRQLANLEDQTINCFNRSNDIIYVGTGSGLVTLDAKSLEFLDAYKHDQFEYSISKGGVSCILHDRDQNVWFGSTEYGLNIISSQDKGFRIHFIKGKSNNFRSYSASMLVDGNSFYIGNQYGIAKVSKDFTEFYQIPKLENFNRAIRLNEDLVAFGSFMRGMQLYDGKDFIPFNTDLPNRKLTHNHVRSVIMIDSTLYIGTWGGGLNTISLRDDYVNSFEFTKGDDTSLSDNDIVTMVKENDSILWIATYGGGVNRFNLKTHEFKRFKHVRANENTISSNDVIELHIDSNNRLWVGSWGGGLDFIDLNKLEINRIASRHELPGYIVTAIEEDIDGRIWFSTKSGIGMYDPVADMVFSYKVSGFSETTFEIGSSSMTSEGIVYFGGTFGCVSVNTKELEKINYDSKIVFTELSILGEQIESNSDLLPVEMPYMVSQKHSILLDYYHNLITIHFANPIFPSSEDFNYEVKMEGFDEDWRAVGNATNVSYTNLDPGDYSFLVRGYQGSSNNYIESDTLLLSIGKPWWATYWSFMLYAFVFIGLLYLFFRYSTSWATIKNKLQTEQILRVKENELNELKQKLFTNLSHEIRTPLTLITNSIDQLTSKKLLDKDSTKSFKSIRKNIAHLSQLTDEIIDFRRSENNKWELDFEQTDLIEFVNEIFLSFTDAATKKSIDYSFEVALKELIVDIDPNQMEKVIYNLLSNALKFTEESGRVRMIVEADEQFAYIKVQDTGVGIKPEDYKIIFEPFSQGAKIIGKSNGFGLGLYISKEIVAKHSGEILVESNKSGSLFMIRLPKSQGVLTETSNYVHSEGSLDTKHDDKDTFSGFENRTILIVEDNKELRNYLKEIFSPFFNVLVAKDGEEALSLALNKIPDIIVSDVMMPKLDGIAFTKKLKIDKRTSHIPIVLLTARTSLIFKNEGYETGADDYITKPFNKHILFARVKNLLQNRLLVAQRIKQDVLTAPADLMLNSRDEEFLQDLTKLIDDNILKQDISAALLSRELGMSHSVIYRKLKTLTGMSMVEFVRDYRLKLAANLIRNNKMSVSDTAFKVGFSDTKYFSKMFKKKFGVNPSKYFS